MKWGRQQIFAWINPSFFFLSLFSLFYQFPLPKLSAYFSTFKHLVPGFCYSENLYQWYQSIRSTGLKVFKAGICKNSNCHGRSYESLAGGAKTMDAGSNCWPKPENSDSAAAIYWSIAESEGTTAITKSRATASDESNFGSFANTRESGWRAT